MKKSYKRKRGPVQSKKTTFDGIKFADIPIRILLRYNVNPKGINTTTPVIK